MTGFFLQYTTDFERCLFNSVYCNHVLYIPDGGGDRKIGEGPGEETLDIITKKGK
jgi:hypothetical protein